MWQRNDFDLGKADCVISSQHRQANEMTIPYKEAKGANIAI